ncbi:Regulator of V-ATPase in vacuolar membrane protein 1 [Zancudomyces culisetae]|uniref:Regulator of V-ATPase in vacuolar membrane protein 1 n=1 Tax=Zancudomyces culisetae TaxID=1213189 RepID=A0A1R1PSE4_ZANCU|nr:Regulator of V-ATPase in vacuolar membrane protein 1 [Zancudomyces culisetae]|eukprot:OMH83813.1 Regulator of V-ATPase in vacuolar membrane protein 1 [Zancudomyces culisetae]
MKIEIDCKLERGKKCEKKPWRHISVNKTSLKVAVARDNIFVVYQYETQDKSWFKMGEKEVESDIDNMSWGASLENTIFITSGNNISEYQFESGDESGDGTGEGRYVQVWSEQYPKLWSKTGVGKRNFQYLEHPRGVNEIFWMEDHARKFQSEICTICEDGKIRGWGGFGIDEKGNKKELSEVESMDPVGYYPMLTINYLSRTNKSKLLKLRQLNQTGKVDVGNNSTNSNKAEKKILYRLHEGGVLSGWVIQRKAHFNLPKTTFYIFTEQSKDFAGQLNLEGQELKTKVVRVSDTLFYVMVSDKYGRLFVFSTQKKLKQGDEEAFEPLKLEKVIDGFENGNDAVMRVVGGTKGVLLAADKKNTIYYWNRLRHDSDVIISHSVPLYETKYAQIKSMHIAPNQDEVIVATDLGIFRYTIASNAQYDMNVMDINEFGHLKRKSSDFLAICYPDNEIMKYDFECSYLVLSLSKLEKCVQVWRCVKEPGILAQYLGEFTVNTNMNLDIVEYNNSSTNRESVFSNYDRNTNVFQLFRLNLDKKVAEVIREYSGFETIKEQFEMDNIEKDKISFTRQVITDDRVEQVCFDGYFRLAIRLNSGDIRVFNIINYETSGFLSANKDIGSQGKNQKLTQRNYYTISNDAFKRSAIKSIRFFRISDRINNKFPLLCIVYKSRTPKNKGEDGSVESNEHSKERYCVNLYAHKYRTYVHKWELVFEHTMNIEGHPALEESLETRDSDMIESGLDSMLTIFGEGCASDGLSLNRPISLAIGGIGEIVKVPLMYNAGGKQMDMRSYMSQELKRANFGYYKVDNKESDYSYKIHYEFIRSLVILGKTEVVYKMLYDFGLFLQQKHRRDKSATFNMSSYFEMLDLSEIESIISSEFCGFSSYSELRKAELKKKAKSVRSRTFSFGADDVDDGDNFFGDSSEKLGLDDEKNNISEDEDVVHGQLDLELARKICGILLKLENSEYNVQELEDLRTIVLALGHLQGIYTLVDSMGFYYLLMLQINILRKFPRDRLVRYKEFSFARLSNTQNLVYESAMKIYLQYVNEIDGFHGSELTKVSWEMARNLGIPLWLNDQSKFVGLIELCARNEYSAAHQCLKKGDDDGYKEHLTIASLFYTLIGRKQLLLQIWKLAQNNHSEQGKIYGFISKLLSTSTGSSVEERAKTKLAATKNAYVLLSKQRYFDACWFFLLGEKHLDAAKVMYNNFKDRFIGSDLSKEGPAEFHPIVSADTDFRNSDGLCLAIAICKCGDSQYFSSNTTAGSLSTTINSPTEDKGRSGDVLGQFVRACVLKTPNISSAIFAPAMNYSDIWKNILFNLISENQQQNFCNLLYVFQNSVNNINLLKQVGKSTHPGIEILVIFEHIFATCSSISALFSSSSASLNKEMGTESDMGQSPRSSLFLDPKFSDKKLYFVWKALLLNVFDELLSYGLYMVMAMIIVNTTHSVADNAIMGGINSGIGLISDMSEASKRKSSVITYCCYSLCQHESEENVSCKPDGLKKPLFDFVMPAEPKVLTESGTYKDNSEVFTQRKSSIFDDFLTPYNSVTFSTSVSEDTENLGKPTPVKGGSDNANYLQEFNLVENPSPNLQGGRVFNSGRSTPHNENTKLGNLETYSITQGGDSGRVAFPTNTFANSMELHTKFDILNHSQKLFVLNTFLHLYVSR